MFWKWYPSFQFVLVEKEFEFVHWYGFIFHVKLSGSTTNFFYQLIDETWMDQLWKSACTKQLNDVEFLFGEKSFCAHRFILSSRSPVFAAMFSSEMIEATTGKVEIVDTEPDVFEIFLKFLYTGTLEPFYLASDDRLALADKYQVETLLAIYQSFPPVVEKEDVFELFSQAS